MTGTRKTPDDDQLGGADESRLQDVARAGNMPESDQDPVPWDSDWVDTFRRWGSGHPEGEAIVLLFSDRPRVLGADYDSEVFHLFSTAPAPPAPGAYVLGRAATSHAWKLALPSDKFLNLCRNIAQDPELNNLPAVILGRRPNRMIYYAAGLGTDGGEGLVYDLGRTEDILDESRLQKALDVYATEQLNTQEMHRTIWERPAKWRPKERAEQLIQRDLLVALRVTFQHYSTWCESNVPTGRVDLAIRARSTQDATCAVLELKVLRTFSNLGGTEYKEKHWIDWLDEGRIQAISYGKEMGASIRMLCAFDMRKEKTPAAISKAKEGCCDSGVTFRVDEIFNTAKAARQAKESSRPED